jgi:hypothetical protein
VSETPPAPPESGLRLERLLPIACMVAAGVLFASEFMTAFEFVPPGGEALADQSAADRHSYAQAILAIFAIVALIVAVSNGSKPAATAVAACGVIALLIFLLLDLPDANNIGTFDDPRQSFFDAEAVPQAGFWLQLAGALGLAISGAALATLTSDQIAALGPGGGRKPKPPRERKRRRRPPTGKAIIDQAEGLGEEVREKSPTADTDPTDPAKTRPAKSGSG